MLAARALGIGSVLTTLHPCVTDRIHELFGIPAEGRGPLLHPPGLSRGPIWHHTRALPTSENHLLRRVGQPAAVGIELSVHRGMPVEAVNSGWNAVDTNRGVAGKYSDHARDERLQFLQTIAGGDHDDHWDRQGCPCSADVRILGPLSPGH